MKEEPFPAHNRLIVTETAKQPIVMQASFRPTLFSRIDSSSSFQHLIEDRLGSNPDFSLQERPLTATESHSPRFSADHWRPPDLYNPSSDQLKKEIESLKQQNFSLKQEQTRLNSKTLTNWRENDLQKQRMARECNLLQQQFKIQQSEMQKQIARLSSVNSSQRIEIDHLYQQKAEAEASVHSLGSELSSFKKRYEYAQQQVSILQSKLQQLENQENLHKKQQVSLKQKDIPSSQMDHLEVRHPNFSTTKFSPNLIQDLVVLLKIENQEQIIPCVKSLKQNSKLTQRLACLVKECSLLNSSNTYPTHKQIWKCLRRLMEEYIKLKKCDALGTLKRLQTILGVKNQSKLIEEVKNLLIRTKKQTDFELEEALSSHIN